MIIVEHLIRFWGGTDVSTIIQGPQGPQGPVGPEGPQGEPGASAFTEIDCGVFKSSGADVSTASFVAKIDTNVILKGGTYYVFWVVRYTGSNITTEAEFRVEVEGSERDTLAEGAVSDADAHFTWSSFDIIELTEGSTNFKFEHRMPGGSGNLTVSSMKIGFILVKPDVVGPL